MKYLRVAAVLMALAAVVRAQSETKLFPYDYKIDDLPNGLRLITVPTEHQNLVSLYILVQTGSRNEVEAGKTGFAHLFEHMMFRGSQNYTADQRDAILKRAGAESNATTSSDRTLYYETLTKDDLDEVMKLEADRFQHLKYSEEAFKTESLAVLGEYNKGSADPGSKLSEVLASTAFHKHTYSHTTMGFLKDIQDMPNQFRYSLEFYNRYYRPEYTTIILVGDVTRERALELTRRYFGNWERGSYRANIPAEPRQTEARSATIDWPSPTLPIVVVAFHGPEYSDENKDKAALDLLSPLAFGPTSELYQRLVLREQKVESLNAGFGDRIDPGLFSVQARVKDPKDIDYVRGEILAVFKHYTDETVTPEQLDRTRSRIRYSFALRMDSTASIANAVAAYVTFRRTPETINTLFSLYQRITPEDIRAAANKFFIDSNAIVVTLRQKAPVNPGGQKE